MGMATGSSLSSTHPVHNDGAASTAVDKLLAEEVAAHTEDHKRIVGQIVRQDVLPEFCQMIPT